MTPEWMTKAACQGMTPDLFFRDWRNPYWEGRRVCGDCPVRLECLRYALDNRIDEGLFGGVTPEQRLRMQGRRMKRYAS